MSTITKKVERGNNGDLVVNLDEEDLRSLGLQFLFDRKVRL